MARKILVGIILAAFVTSCFAGYSGGGRSGFSGGSRSFSSSKSYSSMGRSGYSRSTYTSRAYVAPRTYSRAYSGSASNTIIHNNHYSHGGFGGSGFFHGFLGGYLGSSMANNHHTTVVAGGGQVIPQGQGMLVEPGYVTPGYGIMTALMGFLLFFLLSLFVIWVAVKVHRSIFDDRNYYRSRW